MIGSHVVTLEDGSTVSFPPDMADADINTALANRPPQLDPLQQGVRDLSDTTATAVLKGFSNTLGLPHAVGQLSDIIGSHVPIDTNMGSEASSGTAAPAGAHLPPDLSSYGARGIGEYGAGQSDPGWLTRHTYSGEDINKGIFGGVSALSQATGGRPIEPYEATSGAGRILQTGLEQAIPSMVGGNAAVVPRTIAGIASGAGGEWWRQNHPDAPMWQQMLASVAGGVAGERGLAALTGTKNYVHGLLSQPFAQAQQEGNVAANIARNAGQSGSQLANRIDQTLPDWTPGSQPHLGAVLGDPGVQGMVYADMTAAAKAGEPKYTQMAGATNVAQRAAVAGATPTDADALLRQAVTDRDAAVAAIPAGVTQQEAGRVFRENLQTVYDQRAAKRAAGGGQFDALLNNPAQVDLATLRDDVMQRSAQHAGEVGKAYQAAAGQFRSATGLTLDTPAFADSVRKGLNDLERSYPPGSAAQRAVQQVRNDLDATLTTQVPEIGQAAKNWAKNSIPLDPFRAAPFNKVLATDRFNGRYEMPGDTVAANFLHGNGSATALDDLHKIFGDPETATKSLQDFIAGQVRDKAIGANGAVDPAKLASTLAPYQRAMMRFPTLQKQFATAEGAQAALTQREAYQTLYDKLSSQLGTGQVDAAGGAFYSPAAYRKFVGDNSVLIDQAYSPAQAATVRRVNDELESLAQTAYAKVPGTSGTAQLTPGVQAVRDKFSHAFMGSVLGGALGFFTPAGVAVGHALGSTAGFLSGASSEARQQAFDLVRRNALTDPVYAANLLRKYDPSGVNTPAAIRAMKYVMDRTPTLAALSGGVNAAAGPDITGPDALSYRYGSTP